MKGKKKGNFAKCDECRSSFSQGFKIENYNSDECQLWFFISAVRVLGGGGQWKFLAMMLQPSSMLIKESPIWVAKRTDQKEEEFWTPFSQSPLMIVLYFAYTHLSLPQFLLWLHIPTFAILHMIFWERTRKWKWNNERKQEEEKFYKVRFQNWRKQKMSFSLLMGLALWVWTLSSHIGSHA